MLPNMRQVRVGLLVIVLYFYCTIPRHIIREDWQIGDWHPTYIVVEGVLLKMSKRLIYSLGRFWVWYFTSVCSNVVLAFMELP